MFTRSTTTKDTLFLELTDDKKIKNKNKHNINREEVNIDFEEASDCWLQNKKKRKNGDYGYLCNFTQKNGKQCNRFCCDKIGFYSGCKIHYAWEEKLNKMI